MYSRNSVNSIIIEDENSCKKKMPNIKNITLFSKGRFFSNYFLYEQEIYPDFFSSKEEIVIIGIELDGTVGIFRTVEKDLIENGFRLKESIIYPTGIYLNIYEN